MRGKQIPYGASYL